MLLAVDTSTRYGGVALADEARVVVIRSWHSRANHSVELMPAVAQTLQSRGLVISDLEGLAIALGPGGFSALRVGMSVVKGLAMTTGKPLVGLGTLDLESYPYLGSGLAVCALLDAGRSEVASAYFGPDGVRTREDIVSSPEELIGSIKETTLFCGEGVANWHDLIKERLGSKAIAVRSSPASRLWSLAEMGWQRLAAGDVSDLVTLQPDYLRLPSIGGPKRRDWAPQHP